MSNFDFEAYRKVFPEVKAEAPKEIDSMVDTFKPTEEELENKATDNEPGVAEEGNVNDNPEEPAGGESAEEPAKGD